MDHTSRILIELGSVAVGLALLARLASRIGFSAIPLYLLSGLAFGNGGLVPLELSRSFIQMGAEMGVLLLLFLLGLEYTGEELRKSLSHALPAGAADFVLNFPPGLITGWLLGWSPLAATLLGGITYISSSGIAAKVLTDLKRLNYPETHSIFAVLMMEDLAMAVFLPLCAVLLIGGSAATMAVSVSVATISAMLILFVAVRFGRQISEFAAHESDEVVLLTTFGSVLLVAGIAQRLQVSAAIGAFLAGIALSGPIAEQSRRVLSPLRDLFAAMFFFFFGLQIAPATLPAALPLAILLAVVTAATKILTGYWASRRAGVDRRGGIRAGATLVARGEFSIVLAGLGAGLEPKLGALAAAYVLTLAVAGPLLARVSR
jgi:CPA2 family monovalent cation:H+ antiporter-2